MEELFNTGIKCLLVTQQGVYIHMILRSNFFNSESTFKYVQIHRNKKKKWLLCDRVRA